MIKDLIAFAETTGRDPLVGAFAIIVVGVLVSRFLFRQQLIWRAIARVVFLILLTLLLLNNGIVPYQPLDASGEAVHDVPSGDAEDRLVALGGLVLSRLNSCGRRV